jgi:hypothetical protein
LAFVALAVTACAPNPSRGAPVPGGAAAAAAVAPATDTWFVLVNRHSGKALDDFELSLADGGGTRHPRVRFGNPVHVYNNLYNGNEYGVASTMGAGVLVEGNVFENVDEPTLVGYADSGPGTLVQRNNLFTGSGTPQAAGSVARIPYPYTPEPASTVKASVRAGAGANRITV